MGEMGVTGPCTNNGTCRLHPTGTGTMIPFIVIHVLGRWFLRDRCEAQVKDLIFMCFVALFVLLHQFGGIPSFCNDHIDVFKVIEIIIFFMSFE